MSRLSPLRGTLYVGAPAWLGSDFWRERATQVQGGAVPLGCAWVCAKNAGSTEGRA
ncbi:hypothetical protein QYF50_22625 [Paenibacillus vini]|uniref:hypothetical protein n=1 Tax=Paenibacillus vini TaxID=1476024 RepID=UPI0025B702B8|nr:hypothetical protein [Paenibacillus vini]MDN4070702.1 hypothetical protein [Paenibacillus vini]